LPLRLRRDMTCYSSSEAIMSIGAPVIIRDPEILSGMPVFAGTRVPAKNLIDYLEHGRSVDEFLDDFPTVSRDQVIAVLEEVKELLVTHATAVG
jgi:uncharacterized protein (DUF433 family)